MENLSKAEDLIKLIKAANARADAAKARADKAEARADKAEAREDKAVALREGTYYATIAEVIELQSEPIPTRSLDAVRRKTRCDRFYRTAIVAAEAPQESLRPATKVSRASGYDEGGQLEAKKRKRSIEINGLDGTAQEAADIVLLVPPNPQCTSFYGELLEALVGVSFEDPKEMRLQVLIHGQQGEDGKEKKTGIKHCVMNLIRVMCGKLFMDHHPSQVLLLPILEVDEVLRFGEDSEEPQEYWIAVICASPDVYKQMVLTGDYEVCQGDGLNRAMETLRKFTFAVAEHARDNVSDDDLRRLTTENTVLLTSRAWLLQSQVITPTVRPSQEDQQRHVLKLKLKNDGKGATTCDP